MPEWRVWPEESLTSIERQFVDQTQHVEDYNVSRWVIDATTRLVESVVKHVPILHPVTSQCLQVQRASLNESMTLMAPWLGRVRPGQAANSSLLTGQRCALCLVEV